MSDQYKHISEKAARKASEALAQVKAEQRAEARAKMQEQEQVDIGFVPFRRGTPCERCR